MGFSELMREVAEGGKDPNTRMDPKAALAQAGQITALRNAYTERNEFKPGDLVEWKPGLRNKKAPDYGQPCVVMSGSHRVSSATCAPSRREPSGSVAWRQAWRGSEARASMTNVEA